MCLYNNNNKKATTNIIVKAAKFNAFRFCHFVIILIICVWRWASNGIGIARLWPCVTLWINELDVLDWVGTETATKCATKKMTRSKCVSSHESRFSEAQRGVGRSRQGSTISFACLIKGLAGHSGQHQAN